MIDDLITPERFKAELREALLEHVRAAPEPRPLPSHARRRSKRPAAVSLALGAVLAAIVLVLSSGGELRPQTATAAGVLSTSAAALERHAPSLMLGSHQYLYSRTLVWFRYALDAHRSFVVRSVDETWVARNAPGRSRSRVLSVSGIARTTRNPLTRSQDVRVPASSRPFLISPAPYIHLSYAQLQHLPTSPPALSVALARIAQRHGLARVLAPLNKHPLERRQQRAVIMFSMLRLLAESPAPVRVRAAVYGALARTPAVRLLGRQRDAIGRQGMAVSAAIGPVELELIINPSTGELLQTSRTLLHRSSLMPGYPAGLVNRDTYLQTTVVKSVQARQ